MSDSVRPHRWQPTRLPRPWDSPGKNTGVGPHFLLQCRKVKSESEVAQSCLTLSDPMDCSLPGSSIHQIFQATVLEWIFQARFSRHCLLHRYTYIPPFWTYLLSPSPSHPSRLMQSPCLFPGPYSKSLLAIYFTHGDVSFHVTLSNPFLMWSEEKWSESHSVMSNSLQPYGLYSPRNSPGQNTGVGSLSLLQGIFPTQGSNPGLPHFRQILYQPSQKESPKNTDLGSLSLL